MSLPNNHYLYDARKTKIIATIGPASNSPDVLREMMRQGMNCARLNFSHGTLESHKKNVDTIRKVATELGVPFSVLMDLQGPKIRVGKLKDQKKIPLIAGQKITISTDDSIIGNEKVVSTSYKHLAKDAKVGKIVLIDDGLIQLRVLSKDEQETEIHCEVIVGGYLGQHKGINLPGTEISAPALTKKDIEDLKNGLTLGVDYVCLSFVRDAKDISMAKDLMKDTEFNKCGNIVPVVAKIERQEAVDNFESILRVADGIMVARGDLGVEVPYFELPFLQKDLISKASKYGKIDITATQMLASMVDNPVPSRAEISDIANAVYDGTDVVMLSNESAVGKYPVESIKVMADIARTADSHFELSRLLSHTLDFDVSSDKLSESTVIGAVTAANSNKQVKLIAIMTYSGLTAMQMSQYRTTKPVFAFSKNKKTYNQLAIAWGIKPVLIDGGNLENTSDPLQVETVVADYLKEHKLIEKDELFVLILGGGTVGGLSNTIKISKVH